MDFVSDFLHESSELLVAIYKQKKDFVSAARILSRAGQDKEAAKCLVLSGDSEARQLAATSLLRDLWSQAFFVDDLSILRESWDILDTIPKGSLGDVLAFEVRPMTMVIRLVLIYARWTSFGRLYQRTLQGSVIWPVEL